MSRNVSTGASSNCYNELRISNYLPWYFFSSHVFLKEDVILFDKKSKNKNNTSL